MTLMGTNNFIFHLFSNRYSINNISYEQIPDPAHIVGWVTEVFILLIVTIKGDHY